MSTLVAVAAVALVVPRPGADGAGGDSDAGRLQAARQKASAKRLAFDQPDQALDYFLAQRMPVGDTELPMRRYATALRHRAAMPQEDRRPTLSKLGTPQWRQSGPDNIGGRTRDLVFDPSDPDTMFAAAVSGGVWISRDAAQSWQQAGHEMANLAVVSLAFEPVSGRLFAGTGEGVYVNRPVARSRGVRGNGIFVSDDRGARWLRLEATADSEDFDYVNDLAFDAAGVLYAATRSGVMVSPDGGRNFSRQLDPGIVEGCTDLGVSSEANTIIASCGAHSSGGLWVSRDQGANWVKTLGDSTTGRSSLAVAPSQTRTVYALVADPVDYGMRRVVRSDDGGLNWQTRVERGTPNLPASLLLSNALANTNGRCNAVQFAGGQGWFDNVIAVDPTNPQVLWAGGIDLQRSDDGGRTFAFASRWFVEPGASDYVHADQHVIAFHPDYDGDSQRRLYVANDGGIHSTDNPTGGLQRNPCAENPDGVRWQQRNQGYFATQFYHGDVSADGSLMAGGAQDNGTLVGPPEQPAAWRTVYGGDGVYTLFDPRNSNVAYLGSQFANLQRTDDGFATIQSISRNLPLDAQNALFITPLTLDALDPDTLYTGGRAIFRSSDRGDQWTSIANATLDPFGGIASALSVAPDNSNRLVVGFNSGTLAITDNARAGSPSWRVSRPRQGFVSGITQTPGNGPIYVTYSTFGGSKLFASVDGGASWQALDRLGEPDGLPDIPLHDLLIDPIDPTRLLLATDIGLFIGLENGARWAADASGLGNVLIERLVARQRAGVHTLHAFTYGRGALTIELPDLPSRSSNPGWTGIWFDPDQLGQGVQIEVIADTNTVVMGWYTHAPEAAPPDGSGQLWLSGAGTLRDGRAEILLQRAQGRFNAPGSSLQSVGTVTLQFEGCDLLHLDHDLSIDGVPLQGTRSLQRLIPNALCEPFRTLGDGAISTLPRVDHPSDIHGGTSGTWYQPVTAGQGFLFEFIPGQTLLFTSWYTYDFSAPAEDGTQPPLWLTAIGPATADFATLEVTLTRGGAFDSSAPVEQSVVGTLRIRVTDCLAASADYDITVDGEQRSGTIALERLTPATLCRAPATP
jgi:hypothetical protein